jgi:hypothetical protein
MTRDGRIVAGEMLNKRGRKYRSRRPKKSLVHKQRRQYKVYVDFRRMQGEPIETSLDVEDQNQSVGRNPV